ncbi:MAG: PorT family protein [Cyclobacteriaceae bacterium]|nr:PorT family protein [Cyclobacteriaceae bacterium]
MMRTKILPLQLVLGISLLSMHPIASLGQGYRVGLTAGIASGINRVSTSDAAQNEYVSLRQNSNERIGGLFYQLTVETTLSKKWSIQTGLVGMLLTAVARDLPVSSVHLITNPQRQSYLYRQDFFTLGIPVYAKGYLVHRNRVSLYCLGGVDMNYMFDSGLQRMYRLPGGAETTVNEFETVRQQPFNVGVLAGIGLEYQVNKRFILHVQPSYRQLVRDVWRDEPQEYLGTFNVNVGWAFQFSTRATDTQ